MKDEDIAISVFMRAWLEGAISYCENDTLDRYANDYSAPILRDAMKYLDSISEKLRYEIFDVKPQYGQITGVLDRLELKAGDRFMIVAMPAKEKSDE